MRDLNCSFLCVQMSRVLSLLDWMIKVGISEAKVSELRLE